MSGETLAVLMPEGINTLITSTEAASIAGVTVSTIRTWKERGLISPAGLDERNRPLYRLADIAQAERKTRQRNWGKLT
jgi:DNA-binding transcriptional MerR regulator